MHTFFPKKIYLDESVQDLPLTRRILATLPLVDLETLPDVRHLKLPQPITPAKKILVITKKQGEKLKPFPKIKHALNLGDYVFNPVSNCHLECTYCILQSYLANNPALTLFANTEDFLSEIRERTSAQPAKTWRIGTGELSDSLALDPLTGLSEELIPFFAELPNAFLELKTKTDAVTRLLPLEHQGKTVLSWSMAPQQVTEQEEHKCASLTERLQAAQQAQTQGYPVGIHLDPMLYLENWEEAYGDLVTQLAKHLDPKRLAWVSMGTLRFDKPLKGVASQRFPGTNIFAQDFVEGEDGKFRYFKTIRLKMYQKMWQWLGEWSEDFPRYLCMEAPWMWKQVTGKAPLPAEEMEAKLTQRLIKLRKT